MKKSAIRPVLFSFFLLCSVLLLISCGGGGGGGGETGDSSDDGGDVLPAGEEYVLLAWSESGMHCLNPNYETAVILPPYNNVWAQVIRRDDPPEIVTSGLTLEYRIINNTSSADKVYAPFDAVYGQFWDYVVTLFGVDLEDDTGLNLKDPDRNNGLSGTMVVYDNHYEVNGVPVTPVDDSGTWNPYQVMEVTARDGSGEIVAQTRTTVPVSDEIHCDSCHGNDPFLDILADHDDEEGTNLSGSTPVLCADCHGSPALGTTGPGSSGKYLSEAIHGFHASLGASCYDCHPGSTTQCSRSLAHTDADGNCIECHGTMAQVADSIDAGRTPWFDEPKCVTCHDGVAGVDTGSALYRDSTGHGDLSCAACHGSQHAMVPSREAADNYQALQYQGEALTLGSCAVCHNNSRGDSDMDEFLEEHGGNNRETACNICHTSINTTNTALWPHRFQWEAR